MPSFALILICFTLGILFRVRKIFPESTAHVLNRFIIYISLPALTLKELHRVSLNWHSLPAIGMAWLHYFLAALFFVAVASRLRLSRKSLGTLILTGGLGNTSFVGFPLLEALYGAGALSLGVLIDQPGTFLVTGTLGVFTACLYSAQKPKLGMVLKKIFLFPPFQAVLLALVLHPVTFPTAVTTILEKLAITLIPLALVAVGFQLRLDRVSLRKEWPALMLGLGFKLLVAPLLICLIYVGLFHGHGRDMQIILTEAAMAPMITAGILASEYDLNAELASLMIGVGIPLSLLTVPLWSWLFGNFV